MSSLGTYRARSCSGRAGPFEPSGAPQLEQKELPALYGVEQTGQVETRDVPQFEQKEASSLFECPQVGHCIATPFNRFAARSLQGPGADRQGWISVCWRLLSLVGCQGAFRVGGQVGAQRPKGAQYEQNVANPKFWATHGGDGGRRCSTRRSQGPGRAALQGKRTASGSSAGCRSALVRAMPIGPLVRRSDLSSRLPFQFLQGFVVRTISSAPWVGRRPDSESRESTCRGDSRCRRFSDRYLRT